MTVTDISLVPAYRALKGPTVSDYDGVPVRLGGWRGCVTHHGQHGVTYAFTLEGEGPNAVHAMVLAAERAGHALDCDITGAAPCCDHVGVLDVLDEAGDITGDRCIPTESSWGWWMRAAVGRWVEADRDCPG